LSLTSEAGAAVSSCYQEIAANLWHPGNERGVKHCRNRLISFKKNV